MARWQDLPSGAVPAVIDFQPRERLFYRDRLRSARYAALEDAEGFEEICFALEALGLRLLGKQEALGLYRDQIALQANRALVFSELPAPSRCVSSPLGLFSRLFRPRATTPCTRAPTRHATQAAIELCIGLEEALMAGVERTVENLMVSSPVAVESWQPVAHARQLMLMHSFSFLPVRLDGAWCLVSELGLAKYLSEGPRKTRLCESIAAARSNGMQVREIAPGRFSGRE